MNFETNKRLADVHSELETIQRRLQEVGQDFRSQDLDLNDENHLHFENRRLKEELKKMQTEVDGLFNQLASSSQANLKVAEAEAECSLYKRQTEELRKLLSSRQTVDRFKDQEDVLARLSALEDRIRELQSENFELRRQLAGLTPERFTTNRPSIRHSSHLNDCTSCLDIQKQKAQQAKYYESKLMESRKLHDEYRNECKKLNEKCQMLQSLFSDSENNYKELLEKHSDSAKVYKSRSERLERQNVALLKGLSTDVDLIKLKLAGIEKALLKTQLNFIGKNSDEELIRELRSLTNHSNILSNQLKRLQNKT